MNLQFLKSEIEISTGLKGPLSDKSLSDKNGADLEVTMTQSSFLRYSQWIWDKFDGSTPPIAKSSSS